MRPVIQMTGGELAAVRAVKRAAAFTRRPAARGNAGVGTSASIHIGAQTPDLSVPERGSTGPVPIGDLLGPLQKIIRHPDRGRLLAEFCKQHL